MPPFDASSISQFSAIRLPFQFAGTTDIRQKWFVVLAHNATDALCIKATSKVARYQNDAVLMAGCAFFTAGEITCFIKDTALQPDNEFSIPHKTIENHHATGKLTVSPTCADCKQRLIQAVTNSIQLSGRDKARILGWIQ